MKIPPQARRQAKQLLRLCMVNGALDDNRIRTLVRDFLTRQPRGFLQVLVHFKRLVQLEFDRRLARIDSAVPLPPSLQAAFQAHLTRQYGPGLQFRFTRNPALLGGVRVQVGSDVFDGTIHAHLEELRESF
ncbi:MAG: F0F1 ATP synthase subunit delta [Candidatus Omnitrophica bacterium]|nr:F0F1 ATP synthase subunit delta [Candidatus Omnitrophota bacterium]